MQLNEPEQQLAATLQASRYIAAAVILAVLWTVESVAPMFMGRRRRMSHGLANFGLAIINGAMAFGFAFGILYVTEVSRLHEIGILHRIDMPTWLKWIVALVAFDCWQYWWHRFNHRVPLLWRFHAVHHSDAELDATSAVRFHTVEIAFSFLARMLVLPAIGMTVPQLLLYEAITLPIVIFHHSNIRMPGRLDRVLRFFIVTPWMHWVHHSRWRPETDSNYSSCLSVWDRLFGSFRLRQRPQTIHLGLDEWTEKEWRGLWGMLRAPFAKPTSRRADAEKGDEPADLADNGGQDTPSQQKSPADD